MIVKLGIITSSPGFKSKALKASSRAAVPLETEIPFAIMVTWQTRLRIFRQKVPQRKSIPNQCIRLNIPSPFHGKKVNLPE